MEDGRWKQVPESFGEEERRLKRDGRGKREDGSNCLNPLGKKREERWKREDGRWKMEDGSKCLNPLGKKRED